MSSPVNPVKTSCTSWLFHLLVSNKPSFSGSSLRCSLWINVIPMAIAYIWPSPWFYSTFIFHGLGAMSWTGSHPAFRPSFVPPRPRGLLELIKLHCWLVWGPSSESGYLCLLCNFACWQHGKDLTWPPLRIHLVSGSGFWFTVWAFGDLCKGISGLQRYFSGVWDNRQSGFSVLSVYLSTCLRGAQIN